MTTRVSITVTMDLPTDATAQDVREYVERAVKNWAGSHPTEDPLFAINRSTIVIGPPLVRRV